MPIPMETRWQKKFNATSDELDLILYAPQTNVVTDTCKILWTLWKSMFYLTCVELTVPRTARTRKLF